MLRHNRTKAMPIHADYIVPRSQHRLSKTDISPNALKVVNKLVSAGFQAYIVGGGVRDLLLGRAPKDFDIATNATPSEVRGLFRNARVIGRRFKLVHVIFHREIIEVATFRAGQSDDTAPHTNEKGMIVRDNVFGTLEEDAFRRDFTINSLYYNVVDSSIVDYTGGVQHIHDKKLSIIGDPSTRYQEDPVRMLRAIRFSAKLGFTIDAESHDAIVKLAHTIEHVSHSRLFDEMAKLYQCGASHKAQALMCQYQIFHRLFPLAAKAMDIEPKAQSLLEKALINTDKRIHDEKPVNPAFIFAVMLWFALLHKKQELIDEGTLPLEALEQAMSIVLSNQVRLINIPKRFTQVIREIWVLQFRLPKRTGKRAYIILSHPRFRAAYDFLVLRAQVGDEDTTLAKWWTDFQDVSEAEQEKMIKTLQASEPAKKRRRRRKKTPQAPQ